MLDLLKRKKTINKLHESVDNTNVHYPSSVREWKNSIYVYNKNNLNLIPYVSKQVIKLIKAVFNYYIKKWENKLRRKKYLARFRRLSSNRIYLSNGEFKHKNNNVLVNIYIYNRQINNYLSNIKKNVLKKFLSKKIKLAKIILQIKKNKINVLKGIHKDRLLLMNVLSKTNTKINVIKTLSDLNPDIKNYIEVYNDKKKTKRAIILRKIRLFFRYKKLIHLNRCKLNYNFLYILKKHLETLYNKNVDLNIINLNRFYLNSDILYESVKLKITRDRRSMRRILNKLEQKIKIHKKQKYLYIIPKANTEIKNISNDITLKKSVFNKLKYKHVTGFRLETRGRLTRRNTASRSVYKLKYNGNLLNIDSSVLGLSSVILKGNLRSNLQYTKLNSQTRIGSFGLKGWISGY